MSIPTSDYSENNLMLSDVEMAILLLESLYEITNIVKKDIFDKYLKVTEKLHPEVKKNALFNRLLY